MPCPAGQLDGVVNPEHVYVDTADYDADPYDGRRRRRVDERMLMMFGDDSELQEHHDKYLLGR